MTSAPEYEEEAVPQTATAAAGLPSTAYALTVVVPTRNEAGNIAVLVDRLVVALAGHHAKILFVDDSDDLTPAVVARVAATAKLPVEVLHRSPEERAGGLGSAVLEGFRQTTSPWAVVMDGDLQHPPELVPRLLEAGLRENVDIVVASRHVPGGSANGLANLGRSLVSGGATALTKLLFARNLRGISDPMSGFFAIRRDAFDLDTLRPRGFKILLELLARQGSVTRAEIPFVFAERHAGESKASLAEGVTFVRQLVKLRLSQTVGNALGSKVLHRAAGFGTVGLTGAVVNVLVLWLLADPETLHLNYLVAAVLTTQVASTWNFAFIDALVYRGPKRLSRTNRYAGFMAMSNVVLLVRVPLLALLVSVMGIHYLVANVVTLVAGYFLRFRTQERLTLTEENS